MRLGFSTLAQLCNSTGKITCPVLTIAGADDPTTPPQELAAIARGVAGPVESVVIEPGSHQVAIERPEEFNQVLTRFLED